MKMFNQPSGKAVRGGVRIMLLAGLTLLGACQSWFDDEEPSKKKDSKKEEKKEKTREEKDKERFAFLQEEKAKYKTRPKSAAGETLEQELVKEENTPEEIVQKRAEKISKIGSTALQPQKEKPKAALHFYDDFIILNGDEEIEVNLVFNNAPLLDVLPSFADALGFNFLADSDLRGNVTLNIDPHSLRGTYQR